MNKKENNNLLNGKEKTKEVLAGVINVAAKTGKKGMALAANVIEQTSDGSKVLANEIVKGAKELSEKNRNDNYNKKLKKYNPLFPDEYFSDEFYVPNIIRIVDDAIRRDIDVCKGAIGWREKKRGTEVLFLYDEFVNQCGITFVPSAICEEVYYIDSHNRNRFIKLDFIFQQTHEEKLAELEHIAYCLGAKSCIIEIEEKEEMHDKKKRNVGGKEGRGTVSVEEDYSAEASRDSLLRYKSKSEAHFKGNECVTVPTLKWYAHDNNILNLIEFRRKGENSITSKVLELSSATSATMSKSVASSIDAAVLDMG